AVAAEAGSRIQGRSRCSSSSWAVATKLKPNTSLRFRYNFPRHPFMKLADIAKTLNTRLDNASPDTEITGVAGIEQAAPGQLTFVSNPKYNAAAKTTKASAVIVAENFPAISAGMLRSQNPYLAW